MDLDIEQVEDDLNDQPEYTTIIYPVRVGTRTHSPGGSYKYSSDMVIKRPVEAGRYFICNEPDLPLMKVATHRLKRYCFGCGARKDDADFDRDKRFPMQLAFFCKSCRTKTRRGMHRERVLTRSL